MEKKTPKVWEKIVLKIYWSTVQVLVTHLTKIKDGYKFKWVIKCKDYDKDKNWKEVVREDKPPFRFLHNELSIEWHIDEYGNRWK